jgi:hypothetical protein
MLNLNTQSMFNTSGITRLQNNLKKETTSAQMEMPLEEQYQKFIRK